MEGITIGMGLGRDVMSLVALYEIKSIVGHVTAHLVLVYCILQRWRWWVW